MDQIFFLSQLVVVLLFGIIIISWTRKHNLPETLFLLILGIFLGKLSFEDKNLISLPTDFVSVIIVIALTLVVFDSAQKVRLKELDNINSSILRFSLLSFFANFVLLSMIVVGLFKLPWNLAALFSIIVSSTAPGILFSRLNFKPSKATTILFIESEINTPLMFLLSFFIIDYFRVLSDESGNVFMAFAGPFFQTVVVGAGVGLIFGLILFKLFSNKHSDYYPGIYLFVIALLVYISSEALGGEGVFSVIVLGFIFANTTIKRKEELKEFSTTISLFIEIMSFILLGIVVNLNLNFNFIFLALCVFMIYLAIRYVCVMYLIKDYDTLFNDRIFITLTDIKGLGPSVIVLFLSTLDIPLKSDMLSLIVYFIIFSSILGIYIKYYSKKFLKIANIQ